MTANQEDKRSIIAALKSDPELRQSVIESLSTNPDDNAQKLRAILGEISEDRSHGSPGPKLGAGHAERVAEMHPAGGLPWWYVICGEVLTSIPPSGRFEMVYFALNKSPMMTEVFKLAIEAFKPRRQRPKAPGRPAVLSANCPKISMSLIRGGASPRGAGWSLPSKWHAALPHSRGEHLAGMKAGVPSARDFSATLPPLQHPQAVDNVSADKTSMVYNAS